jgi:hypothetical protein
MRIVVAIALLAGMLAMPGAFAVEPAYKGQFGNNEEPALRPYKWLYRGVKSLVYHTGDQLVEGNAHTPFVGSVQGLRGLRRGTVELGESLYRGGVYAPVPPRDSYKSLSSANTYIENDLFLRNSTDFVFSWYFFPAQKAVDYYPLEGNTKVGLRMKEAREVRMARDAAAAEREKKDPREDRVKRAQRDYIGDRADYGTKKSVNGYGNLMKLAR